MTVDCTDLRTHLGHQPTNDVVAATVPRCPYCGQPVVPLPLPDSSPEVEEVRLQL